MGSSETREPATAYADLFRPGVMFVFRRMYGTLPPMDDKMYDPKANRLLVKVMVGSETPERCAQGFTVAATACASGVEVSLWLTGEAAWLALPGRADEFVLEHSAPLTDLLVGVLAGGTITVCTQCAQRRNITSADLIPGITIAGAAAFVEEAVRPGTTALVY